MLTDLESDYLNPMDLCDKLNQVVHCTFMSTFSVLTVGSLSYPNILPMQFFV